MSDASIRIEPNSLNDTLNLLAAYRQGSKRALYRSINLGAKQGRKAAVDGMAAKANLKKTTIRDKTKVYFASLSKMQAKVVLQSKVLPLTDFGARQTKTGVTFRIWKDKPRQKYKHAFFWTLVKERYTGVFEPNVDSPSFNGFGPYRRKSGPAVPTIYEQTPGLAGKAEETAAQAMLKELDRQVGLINRGLL
ncbi:hypothetical protein [uncultured Marinobacter sp.]|uniref:hypothetical protein n=1 Tax=uncultured Marinobacter sp. TaxID=187379 RepID=UPI0030DD9DB5